MPFPWTWSAHMFGQSARFCSPDADITYKSSNGVLFKIHSLYLKAHTECLAPPDGFSVAEVVNLPEDAETLEYLFQFVYPMPQPDLRSLNFRVVQKLAEAAEKYGVYPAKSRCHIVMQESVNQHPFPVLMYAMRHNYEDLMNRAALLHLKQPIEVAIQGMPVESSITWIRYHATWDFLRREFQSKFCNLPREHFSINDWQILRTLHSGTTWIGYLSLGISGWPTELSDISEQTRQIPTFSEFRKLPRAAPINPHIPEQALISEEPIKHFPNPFKDEPIILRSSDGRRFSVSPAMLKASGNGFPTSTEKKMEIVLEEDSFTLELLLQFLHNMAQPDLSSLDFNRLEPLSEAAHKYRVHYSTSAVKDRLRQFAQSDSIPLLIHAFRINDFELLDLASYYVLDLCPKEVVEQLPDDLIVLWTKYYAMWRKVADKVFDTLLALLPKSNSTSSWQTCKYCKQSRICLSEMSEGVAGLRRLRAQWELERKADPFVFRDVSYTQHGVYRSCHSWLGPVYEASLNMRKIGRFSNVVRGTKGNPAHLMAVVVVVGLVCAYILFQEVGLLWRR